MTLNIASKAMLRTPAFSFDDKLQDVWEELKDCIQHSSPEFYELVKDLSAEQVNSVNAKFRFTIWKYFNRAKYRSTPFGKFAAISFIGLEHTDQVTNIKIERRPVYHRMIDWANKDKIFNLDIENTIHFYQANNTVYLCGNEIRYNINSNGQFELVAIDYIPVISDLINFCFIKRSAWEVSDFLSKQDAGKHLITKNLLVQLVELQIIFTDHNVNIIGEDYFKRVNNPKLKELERTYIISERPTNSRFTSAKKLAIIPEFIRFVHQTIPCNTSDPLSEFKSAFVKKFEYNEVPIMIALDPEMGVSYTNMEYSGAKGSIIDLLSELTENSGSQQKIPYSDFHQFLLKGIISNTTIQMELYKNENQVERGALSNNFSAFVEFADALVILGQVGGCTANALLGRFSMVSGPIEEFCLKNAGLEQTVNPQVLFFDIGYHAEGYVDNVNRRKLLFNYELPLFSWSCAENTLSLNDILVSVHKNEVVLRSARSGKRLIPRIATAYNYSRSDFSVYRFLCDIQYQGIDTGFNFDLKTYFPGLELYPRIQYKHIVVSPAMWMVPNCFYLLNDIEKQLLSIKEWLRSKAINGKFKAGDLDQTLCFDPTDDDDLIALLHYCHKKNQVYIHEAFVPESSIVTDEAGKNYMSQFIVSIEHQKTVYKPLTASYIPYKPNPGALKVPGSDWIYFEIFCHEKFSDELLLIVISPFLKAVRKSIKKWFFIRFKNPTPCIRLRFNIKPADFGFLVAKFSKTIEGHILTGVISDFQLKPYHQELERYGLKNITSVETLFKVDSNYTLIILKKNLDEQSRYILAIKIIKNIMNSLNWTIEEQLDFAKTMAALFSDEANIKTPGFKLINKSFQDLEKKNLKIYKYLDSGRERLEKAFITTLEKAKNVNRAKLLSDLFHMHINRLFTGNQRIHEMLFYNYLVKDLQTLKLRS